ncbi:RNA 2',3'-cyclic phosphodiesterase [uncultured Sphingomonas sp.]|uniref:RNA 2',3'-cyclic phosphodiesterase n=1 Tax=uncultured Sphingomonas sp. TaxID=158754 RepID=UPI0025E22DD0|nr:RNA 2',3'-cyclic phosphodiesterase [uncultured Sphingomonas sp.]
MHRLFLAIRPPEPVRDLLLDLMGGTEGMRWQDEEQLHCTLRFVGEVDGDVAEDLASALSAIRFEAFGIRVQGVGRFEQRRGGALWAGLAPREPLAALAAKIDRTCVAAGLEPERRAYHPHVTLARWKCGAAPVQPFLERHANLASEPWQVARFTLYESHLGRSGAHHEAVADYGCGGLP